MTTLVGALLATVVTTGAHAQAGRDFCADRPGKATPPCILDMGRVQVETGLAAAAFQRSGPEREERWLLGETELRVGVSHRTELQATWAPVSEERTRGPGGHTRVSGVSDLILAVRTSLSDPDRGGPAAAFQVFMTAPIATRGQGAGGWEGGVRLPLAVDVAEGVALGATPEADIRRDADGRGAHAVLAGAIGLSRDTGPVTLTAELWAERDFDPAGHVTRASVDVSVAWMATPDLQFDLGANAGATSTTPDLEVYVGVARRF